MAVAARAVALCVVAAHALQYHVAPMQTYTNAHLNFLLRRLAPDVTLWTEMEKAADVLACDDATLASRLVAGGADDAPPVLQLGGDDARALAAATRRACNLRADLREVNINAGCPAIASGGADYGATLMRDAAATRRLVEAVRDAAPPSCAVSLKCRAGVRETWSDEAPARYEELHAFVAETSSSGCLDHVVVHCRLAILAGLAPGANRCRPPLHPDFARRLASDFPALRVTRNGGIAALGGGARGGRGVARAVEPRLHREDLVALDDDDIGSFGDRDARDDGLDGVMAGRAVLRRPLDLGCAADALGAYADYVRTSPAPAPALAAPLALALEQLRDDGADDDDDALAPLADAARHLGVAWEPRGSAGDLRRLAKGLAKVMGKKVYNKVVRNRNEGVPEDVT